MKIGIPYPTLEIFQNRIKESLSYWDTPNNLLICSVDDKVEISNIEHVVMPRNTSDIGSITPRVYIKDVLETLRSNYPNEKWYGICNSDCVLSGDPIEVNDDYEVLAYNRTDIPDWKYLSTNYNKTTKEILEQIFSMRETGISDKKIARKLNRIETPPPEGHKEWTYITLRELNFKQGIMYLWGYDMFLFHHDIMDHLMNEYIVPKDPILGIGGFDHRLFEWCNEKFKTKRISNKIFHKTHTSEWTTDEVEYKHNGGDFNLINPIPIDDIYTKNWVPHSVENPLSFVKTENMIKATQILASYIPNDIDLIVGIARSGLISGSILACNLHLPLMSASVEGVVDVGSGTRFTEKINNPKKILAIDDTIFSGRTYQRVIPVLRKRFPRAEILKSAIYSTSQAKHFVDYFACELGSPHYLEWNFFNSGLVERSLFDMDGILCNDISIEDDDDGFRYIKALKNAVPKYLPRRTPIKMIVTARLERYRKITEEWLEKHKVKYNELVMGPWKTLHDRNLKNGVATFKSNIYNASSSILFVESCPIQSKEIVKQTGKKVLCPVAGRVFS